MKRNLLPVTFCCLALGLAPATVQGQSASEELDASSPGEAWIGPHHRVTEWTTTTTELDSAGNPVEVEIQNRCVQIGTGLNWLNPISQIYEPSVEAFLISPKGYALAVQGQAKLILAPNINEGASVDLELPDGRRLRSNPMGISYFCTATGKNVLLAEVQSCEGELIEPNVIAYFDAFDSGLKAALRYTYRLASIEQDTVIYANPGPPEAYGLSSDSTKILIYTEFHDGVAPDVRMIEQDGEAEEELSFGSMALGRGTAYFLGAEFDAVPVRSRWIETEGRQFLVEETPYLEVAPYLEKLAAKAPVPSAAQLAGRTVSGREGMVARLSRRARSAGPSVASIRVGKEAEKPGLLFDYVILNTSQTNAVFSGTETYWLRNQVLLYGSNTTFSAGAVFKASNSAGIKLTVNTPVTWGGSVAQPIVLTGQDDSSIGQKLTTNAMSGTYATVALEVNTNTVTLDHLRVVGAKTGVLLNGAGPHTLRHVQMVNCEQGIKGTNTEFRLRNGLFWNVKTNFTGTATTGRVEHLTTDGALRFNDGLSVLTVTNSLLVAVTNWGSSFTSVGSATNASSSGVFAGVGAGQHYLAAGSSYRNWASASTNIESGLLRDLRQTTTYPPLVLTSNFTASTTLSPQAQRDVDALDLGYHHTPLDYCWSGLSLPYNVTLTLTNGVAVGVYGTRGLYMSYMSKLVSEGRAGQLNRLVRTEAVQEQPAVWGASGDVRALVETMDTATPAPEVRLVFTDVAFPAGTADQRRLIRGWAHDNKLLNPLVVVNSQLRGVDFLARTFTAGTTIALTNNVWTGSTLSFEQGLNYYTFQPFTLYSYNNLFQGGTLSFAYRTNTTAWTVKDNLFGNDTLTMAATNTFTVANNGYRSGLTSLGGIGNKTNLTLNFLSGPAANGYGVLGGFYYPTNGVSTGLTNLFNAGSRNATNAGLYHFTVRVDQVKETNSMVEIGYHYVALDSNGLPLDFDGDGFPDYVEDRNGNGVADTGSGETDWQVSGNGTTGVPGLEVFPPME